MAEERDLKEDEVEDFDDDDSDETDDRSARRDRGRRPGGRNQGRGGHRRSKHFYRDQLGENTYIDYRNIELLKHFITDRGKIRPRRQTRISAKQQRAVTRAIKRARIMALLPFTDEHTYKK